MNKSDENMRCVYICDFRKDTTASSMVTNILCLNAFEYVELRSIFLTLPLQLVKYTSMFNCQYPDIIYVKNRMFNKGMKEKNVSSIADIIIILLSSKKL